MIINGYEILSDCGEGAFSTVYKAREGATNILVAIKTAGIFRHYAEEPREQRVAKEIKVLKKLAHQNVINILNSGQTMPPKCVTYLVFPYCPFTLRSLLASYYLTETQSKSCLWMILNGLAYIHECGIIHRDLSARNILIDESGVIKIADFGSAWVESDCPDEPKGSMSSEAGTRYYRAPELFFGSQNYSNAIDLWSVGCILAEFYTDPVGSHLFCEESDLEQISGIFRILGFPTEAVWPEMKTLPDYGKLEFIPRPTEGLTEKELPNAPSTDIIEMIRKFLVYESNWRMSARNALEEPYLAMSDPHLDLSALAVRDEEEESYDESEQDS